jgi:hypothetical protein
VFGSRSDALKPERIQSSLCDENRQQPGPGVETPG